MATLLKTNKCFDGFLRRYRHESAVLGCQMTFSVFYPPTSAAKPVPIVYYLSGLTCTDENVMQKSGAQKSASELGIALIAPDTSPRGLNVEGEADNWDFGVGAGFYLNATQPKWKNWRMYDYIVSELPQVLKTLKDGSLDVDNASIMGHSMGGHGALSIGLKNPNKYKSISAFSPICNPSQVPWGVKAFTGYLGEDKEAWKEYDSTELAKNHSGPAPPILIDTGSADEFLDGQLHPWAFEEAAKGKLDVTSSMRDGYDHSYFFISTFIADHLRFHARALNKSA